MIRYEKKKEAQSDSTLTGIIRSRGNSVSMKARHITCNGGNFKKPLVEKSDGYKQYRVGHGLLGATYK
jgi:hypothetical protein